MNGDKKNQIESTEAESTTKSWREPPGPIDEDLITDAGTFDIVIVGAGTAGLLYARVASNGKCNTGDIRVEILLRYNNLPEKDRSNWQMEMDRSPENPS